MKDAPKSITIRLNSYDQAVFKFCKEYLENKEEENFYYGFTVENITNATVIRKALQLLWEEGRKYKLEHK